MQKSSQGSCLFYIILPAVQRCSKKTKHTAEERITAQQNLRNGRVLPWGGEGGRQEVQAWEAAVAHNTGQQDPGPETLLADGYFRWFISRNVLRTARKNPLKHSSSQRIDIFCRYEYPLSQSASALSRNYLSIHKHSCFLVILCHRLPSDKAVQKHFSFATDE